ncbi:hydantoinase/oxoprolinase family protein [Sulfolobaceae archaeon RB850M]
MTIAVDIGGTFTDVIYLQPDGSIRYYKGLSTPKSPEIGVKNAIQKMGIKVDKIVHATTIATNAILGQLNLELPKTALITTKGFRDVIEIGRQNRPELYNPYFQKPKPLVPRELRFEVDERTLHDGRILKRLNELEVEEIAKKTMNEVSAVAVVFLHSYKNPENELRAKEILSKYFKYVSASFEVSPEQREYERTTTTVINAMLMPIVSKYVESLRTITQELYIMSSSGGLIDSEEAVRRPVQIIESGPSAGVVGAQIFSEMLGEKNVISFDMGGTTAKAGSIVNGEVEITSEYEVGGRAHHGRIVKGSGYPIRFPFIDLAEVSAGGGTIIWRDEGGALRVGPISAGADPGPVCYNMGGKEPTLTDANAVLEILGDSLLGGEMKLNINSAREAISKLGDPVEVSKEAINLASLEMARAIRLVTVERGLDPSEFTLFAFGGAGPQWAIRVAEELGIKKILIPPHPGLFSALALLMVDEKYEIRSAFPKDVYNEFKRLEKELSKRVNVDYFLHYIDARYKGQGWELTIPVKGDYVKEFEERHKTIYGFTLPYPVEVTTVRVFGIKKTVKPSLPDPQGKEIKIRKRRALLIDDWVDVDVYRRDDLPKGYKGRGPAIIEEYSSTIVIHDGWSFEVKKMGFVEVVKEW